MGAQKEGSGNCREAVAAFFRVGSGFFGVGKRVLCCWNQKVARCGRSRLFPWVGRLFGKTGGASVVSRQAQIFYSSPAGAVGVLSAASSCVLFSV